MELSCFATVLKGLVRERVEQHRGYISFLKYFYHQRKNNDTVDRWADFSNLLGIECWLIENFIGSISWFARRTKLINNFILRIGFGFRWYIIRYAWMIGNFFYTFLHYYVIHADFCKFKFFINEMNIRSLATKHIC